MTVEFRPYQAGDAAALRLAREGRVPDSVEALALASWSFTALAEAGELTAKQELRPARVIACGGLARIDTWRGMAWSAMGVDMTPREMVRVRRRIKTCMKLAEADGMTTIETEVALHFGAGHGWVRSLGFVFAGLVPAASGRHVARYVAGDAAWAAVPNSIRAALAFADRVTARAVQNPHEPPLSVLRAA